MFFILNDDKINDNLLVYRYYYGFQFGFNNWEA